VTRERHEDTEHRDNLGKQRRLTLNRPGWKRSSAQHLAPDSIPVPCSTCTCWHSPLLECTGPPVLPVLQRRTESRDLRDPRAFRVARERVGKTDDTGRQDSAGDNRGKAA
jgi:hypothetical protein